MQTTVIFKTDKKLKEAAYKIVKGWGIPFSAIMNAYMQDLIESEEVTFTKHGIRHSSTKHVDKLFKNI